MQRIPTSPRPALRRRDPGRGYPTRSIGDRIARDIARRPLILAGFISFAMLVPLAATSNRFAVARLGRRWITLHNLIYVIACVALLHYWWMVRTDFSKAWLYFWILVALLGFRLNRWAGVGRIGFQLGINLVSFMTKIRTVLK